MLAYNEATGEIGAYPITDVISHVDPEIVLLTIDGETLETTAEHPFYELESAPWLAVGQTAGRWTDALELQAGDRVWKADRTSGVVQSVEVASVLQRMYNLTVDKAHTFFVGQGQWLVHNDCWVTPGGRRIDPNHTDKIFDQRGFTDYELDDIIDNFDEVFVQSDGDGVYLKRSSSGKYDAVITGSEDDNFIVTAFRDMTEKDLQAKIKGGHWSK